MEIKVFKDVSKKESTYGGLTPPQWLLVIGLFAIVVIDVLNAAFSVLPMIIARIISFLLVALLASNALYRPHGFTFIKWLKLFLKFQTTIHIRTYQKEDERMKQYVPKDFKKQKGISETQTSKTKN